MSDVSEMRKRNAKDSVGHSCDGMAASADRRELLLLYDALAAEKARLRRELEVERACHESASAANSKARAILQKIADDMTCDVHARMIASMAVYGVTGIARDTVQPSVERT